MKFNKILNIFRNDSKILKSGHFADFFLKSSADEKKRVFEEVARRSNEDQRKLFKHSAKI